MSEMFEQQRAEAHLGPREYALIKAILEQVRVDGPRLLQTDLYMQQYGPFRATTVKAFSITRRTVDGRSLLKIYRGVEPRARRDREVDALKLASQWSLSVPGVLAIGEQADTSWAVLSIVPGTQSSTTTTSQIDAYIHRALALTADLCRHVEDLIPGSGWRQDGKDTTSTGHHHLLLGQLSHPLPSAPLVGGSAGRTRPAGPRANGLSPRGHQVRAPPGRWRDSPHSGLGSQRPRPCGPRSRGNHVSPRPRLGLCRHRPTAPARRRHWPRACHRRSPCLARSPVA